MRRFIVLVLFFVGLASAGFGQVVEVEHVLDAPTSKFGTFYDDSAVYTKDGILLLRTDLTANVFILNGKGWIPLIKEFRTLEYNFFQEQETRNFYSELVNSKEPDEYLFLVEQRPLPQEKK